RRPICRRPLEDRREVGQTRNRAVCRTSTRCVGQLRGSAVVTSGGQHTCCCLFRQQQRDLRRRQRRRPRRENRSDRQDRTAALRRQDQFLDQQQVQDPPRR